MTKRLELTSDQLHTITHALRVAAERYQEHASDTLLDAVDPRLCRTFAAQVTEANELAELLMETDTVVLETGEA